MYKEVKIFNKKDKHLKYKDYPYNVTFSNGFINMYWFNSVYSHCRIYTPAETYDIAKDVGSISHINQKRIIFRDFAYKDFEINRIDYDEFNDEYDISFITPSGTQVQYLTKTEKDDKENVCGERSHEFYNSVEDMAEYVVNFYEKEQKKIKEFLKKICKELLRYDFTI